MSQRHPLGQRVHLTLLESGADAAHSLARAEGQPDLFDRVRAVAEEAPAPSFLHSALCAMSLPVRKPVDQFAPILRQDGQYTLVINPKPRVDLVEGQQALRSLGIPYGSLPRLILIHIMTEAVRTKNRHIQLGATFTDWMRRLGFRTISYGPRGSATLIRDQLDRLLACEWMIRWDGAETDGAREFGIKEIKLTNEYVGSNSRGGSFQREIFMTEGFFDHLRDHAVPLNEVAIRQLRDSATALDLYTWLAYRLPRITGKRPASLSWQQLATHFGNDGRNIRKFRQTVRDAWERHVSAVYPEARAEFDTTVIRLHASPAPLQRKLVPGAHLRLAGTDDKRTVEAQATPKVAAESALTDAGGTALLAAIETAVGESDYRAWFGRARAVREDEGWVIQVETRFIRDYIRGQFGPMLTQAARAQGIDRLTVDLRRAAP